MNEKLISICIPVYNDAANIDECLNSCITQIQDDIEIIVLDNCSSDGTYEKAKKYQSENVEIKQNRENLGAYGNHNELINISNGMYIKFLHSDDILEKDAISILKKSIENNPSVELFAFNTFYISKTKLKLARQQFTSPVILNSLQPKEFVKFGSFIGTPSMTMFKRSIIKKVGHFDKSMEPSSDTEFWDRVLQSCKVKLCTAALVSVRDDPVTKLQSYYLNQRFYEALLRRLGKLTTRHSDRETQLEITRFKFRMLLIHLRLALRLSIVNFRYLYLVNVIAELIRTVILYKITLKGTMRRLPLSLPKSWYDELIKHKIN